MGQFQTDDTVGGLKVTKVTKDAGEEILDDVQKVEKRSQSTRITTATTTVVATGGGVINGIDIGKHVASGVITVYDNTAASGTILGVLTPGASLLTDPPFVDWLNSVKFVTGLCVVTSQASDLTVKFAQGVR